ncbi:MAG: hypothetical protein ABIV47_07900 [Roseiflexaceae bacterium]
MTITKPFSIGVFEMTQKQCGNVMGTNLAAFRGDYRPVVGATYPLIPGASMSVCGSIHVALWDLRTTGIRGAAVRHGSPMSSRPKNMNSDYSYENNARNAVKTLDLLADAGNRLS